MHEVDLEIAKELVDNGIEVESNLLYCYSFEENDFILTSKLVLQHITKGWLYAPNSDELLGSKWLPVTIYEDDGILKDASYQMEILPFEANYQIDYISIEGNDGLHTVHNKKLSNALAKMAIWLKKEGYVK